MSLLKIIDNLRNESEGRRRRVSFFVSFSVTGVIVVAWLMSVTGGSSFLYRQETAVATTSPLAAVRDAFAEGAGMFGDLILSVKTLGQSTILFTATSSEAGK